MASDKQKRRQHAAEGRANSTPAAWDRFNPEDLEALRRAGDCSYPYEVCWCSACYDDTE